jgi:hypothetical protein
MESIISSLARIKPWLLFVLTTAPMAVALLLFFPPVEPLDDIGSFQASFTKMMLMSIPGILIFYSWILAVGVVCNQSVDVTVRKPERLFRFSVPFAMLSVSIATWAFPEAVLSEDRALLRMIVFPVHFAATILLFYSVFFSARSLAMLDRPHSPGFWRSFRYFLGLLYYPIGLWFIQRRVNALAASSSDRRNETRRSRL